MNVDELYSIYDTLSKATDTISEHSKEYSEAIKATQCGIQEKKLATQIIAKFFPSFPAQQNHALDSMFDLCEDEDKTIRIAAMKSLPSFCKDTVYTNKVADVMAQMLQLDDPTEQTIASNVFLQILKKDPATVIKCIFKTIQDTNIEQFIRFRCIQFILNKIKLLDSNLLTTEIQDLMITNVKSTLNECIADEFVLLMNYLVSTTLGKSFGGQREIFDIVLGQIEINKDFVPYHNNSNFTNRLVCCVKFIIPFFSAKVGSRKLVLYYCDKVLPQWNTIGELKNGIQYQAAIAQQLASMCQFCETLETPSKQVETIFDILKTYMPEPPEDTSSNEMPDFNFTIVESLLSAFHSLASQCPEFLTSDENLLKDFRARLLYFTRGVQGCLKVLNLSGGEKVFNAEEKRIREMCPVLLKNINTLVKDLFYKPPIYKCKITLSFNKKEEKKAMATLTTTTTTTVPEKKSAPIVENKNKRHIPITYESNGASTHNKQKRLAVAAGGGDKKIYTPPSGKFSQNIHRGRGGFKGGQRRGRGGYRN